MNGHDEDLNPTSDERSTSESGEKKPANRTVFDVLRVAGGRLRSDRWLVLPFVVAGAVMSAIDRARQMDPIPARQEASGGLSIDFDFYLYPTGAPETTRSIGAIVDLLPRYLLWAVGLELVVVLAVGLAGWAVISRELDQPREWPAAARYLGVLVVPVALVRLTGGAEIEFTNGGLIIGIPLLVLLAFVLVRLFVLPVCLVARHGVIEAVRESIQTSRGNGWTILGLIAFIGVGTSLLGSVPTVGGVLSTALLAPLHAVAAVAVYENARRNLRSGQ